MKQIALMILLGPGALLPLSAGENPIPAEHQTILQGEWTPTKEQTDKALSAAIILVRQTAAQPAGTSAAEKYQVEGAKAISHEMATYAVQFTGQTRKGQKVIHCSFFPTAEFKYFTNWKELSVMVEDGGYGFWQIDYDPATGKCGELQINGRG